VYHFEASRSENEKMGVEENDRLSNSLQSTVLSSDAERLVDTCLLLDKSDQVCMSLLDMVTSSDGILRLSLLILTVRELLHEIPFALMRQATSVS
jgi:hypothetical protein